METICLLDSDLGSPTDVVVSSSLSVASALSPAGASLVRMAVALTRILRDERQEFSLSLSSHQDVVALLL